MRSGLIAIIKKEFTRFFTDRRMILTTLILPGLMIYLLYTLMGSAMSGMFTVDEDYQSSIYAVNTPASMQSLLEQSGIAYEEVQATDVDGIKQQITDKEVDLLVVFPDDFDTTLATRISAQETGQAYTPPNIEMYYNATRTESSSAFSTLSTLLGAYKTSLSPTFDINALVTDADGATADKYNLATDQDAAGFLFASLLPMLILMFLFSGVMALAPDSIAGEKERGTIATLLVTPLGRWELALGKVVSLGAIALLSGISSFVGVILSLPNLMKASGGGGLDTGMALYSLGDYAMVLGVILSTVLLFVGLVSIISAFAKSVKEAGTMVMPLMIVVMLVGVLGMFSQGAQSDLLYYLIPAYNSVQAFVGIFSFAASPLHVALTIAVNVVLAGLCVVVLTWMFNNEKIVFAR